MTIGGGRRRVGAAIWRALLPLRTNSTRTRAALSHINIQDYHNTSRPQANIASIFASLLIRRTFRGTFTPRNFVAAVPAIVRMASTAPETPEWSAQRVRDTFLDYFKENGHAFGQYCGLKSPPTDTDC